MRAINIPPFVGHLSYLLSVPIKRACRQPEMNKLFQTFAAYFVIWLSTAACV